MPHKSTHSGQSAPAPTALRIAILAYDGCLGTEIFGISDVLLIACSAARAFGHTGPMPFVVQVVGLSGRSVRLAGGITVAVVPPKGKFDMVIVPGPEIEFNQDWDQKLQALARELAFIQTSFAGGSTIASICAGAFLLGEAGLLSGRAATTAWLIARQLAQRFPAARVSEDAILLRDGAIITTGAVSSTFDLALHIVKQTLGAKLATATARVTLLASQRSSQAPYIDGSLINTPLSAPGMPSFSQNVQQWLQSRLAEAYDLSRLAQAFHVSERTLLRRVKAETGKSPLTLLQMARVEKAKQLLANTNWSIARITAEVGYTDLPTFSRLFAAQVGETPAVFRRR
jgi:transcriptional regulator GlxA family with amidase domain